MAEALMLRVKDGKIPWMSTVLKYNMLDEVRAQGVEPREAVGRKQPDKEKNREYAKRSYHKNQEKCRLKNIVYQIRKGSHPKKETLEKYGLNS